MNLDSVCEFINVNNMCFSSKKQSPRPKKEDQAQTGTGASATNGAAEGQLQPARPEKRADSQEVSGGSEKRKSFG